jgi:type IV secretory pathway VirB10-like protein
VVAAPAPDRARTAFVALCLVLLGGGLLALLLVNTAMANGSFRLHDLQAASDQLTDRQQALRQDIAVQAAPERLAARARALGMVPSGSAAFLRLSDGRVLGVAKAAPAPPAPTVSTRPVTKPAKADKPAKTDKASSRTAKAAKAAKADTTAQTATRRTSQRARPARPSAQHEDRTTPTQR